MEDRVRAEVGSDPSVKRESGRDGTSDDFTASRKDGCPPLELENPSGANRRVVFRNQNRHRPQLPVPKVEKSSKKERVMRVHAHSIPNLGTTFSTQLTAVIGNKSRTTSVLIDTGATHSIMDKMTYERLRDPELPELQPSGMTLRGAFEGENSEEVQTSGKWSGIPVIIEDAIYFADFYVSDMATVPVILGMDFLRAHKAKIDCGQPAEIRLTASSSAKWKGPRTGGAGKSHQYAVLRAEPCVELAARKSELVSIKLDDDSEDGTYVFEPAVRDRDLVIPSQLMTVHQGRASIMVANRGLESLELDSWFLGSAEALAKGDDTSRHPGADAIYQPAAHFNKGKGNAGRRSSGKPAGWCAFVHINDVDALDQRVGEDGLSVLPEKRRGTLPRTSGGSEESSPIRRSGREGCSSDATVAASHSEPSKPKKKSCGTSPADAGLGEIPEPKSEGGIPDHLRGMMPPKEDTTPGQRSSLESLVKEYEDIFIKPGGEVGYTDRTTHVINVGNALPVKIPPRKTSFAEKELIESTVSDLLQSGKIKGSYSPWASPIVLVKKKDGTMRFCIDYRRLNDVTVKDAYPLPRIEDALDSLSGAKYFSALDLASAYWQIAMDPDSVDKTAFATHIGLFEWLVMPFGLSNAPATCERLMEQLFQGYQWNGVLVYLDDLVAYGRSWPEALKMLRVVFQKLREANLKLKPSKCFLMARETEYLGHKVCSSGVLPGARKIEAIRHWPAPRSIDEIRSFLGLTGYYRRFVKNYAEVAHPLVALLKKGKQYEWGSEQQRSYELLKQALISYPCLGTIRPSGRLILDTDASDYAVGAVLSQLQDDEERVLGYFSRTLNDAQTRYCTTKKELLAVKSGLEFWDHYLQNPSEPFLLRTDHAALTWLRSMSVKDRTLARWATYVSEYQYECQHRPGRLHTNADALSRVRYPPCDIEDCLCKERRTFQFPEGEETRLRDHAELEIYPKGDGTSTINVRVVTRSQRRILPQSDLPPAETLREEDELEARQKPPALKGESDTQSEAPIASRTRQQIKSDRPVTCNPKDAPAAVQTSGKEVTQPSPACQGDNGRRLKLTRSESECAKLPPAEEFHSPSGEVTGIGGEGEHADPTPSSDEFFESKGMAAWARKDWFTLQRADPVLKRVLALVCEHEPEPVPESRLVREGEEVRLLCRSGRLLKVRKGVLKHVMSEPCDASAPSRRRERIVVPQKWKVVLVRMVHNTLAHLSYRRIYPLLRERFWWRTMGTDLRNWTRCCELCQALKAGDRRGRYPLAQEGYSSPLDRVGIDISGPWPNTSGGQKYILAITNYFSKWLELDALPDKTAMSVAKSLHRFVSRYGIMNRLHSDRGKEFTANVIRHLCGFLGVKQTFTSGHAPWSNAQVERGNRTVKAMLLTLTRQYAREWDECLPSVMQAYNGTEHASTGYTPALLMHSRCDNPRMPLDLLLDPPKETLLERDAGCYSHYVEEQRLRIQGVHEIVREQLEKAASMQSRSYEQGGLRPHQYTVGSEVWYYYPARVTDKLGSPWMGPLRVVAVDRTKNLVKVPLRGGERWLNGGNVKPVHRLESGEFL